MKPTYDEESKTFNQTPAMNWKFSNVTSIRELVNRHRGIIFKKKTDRGMGGPTYMILGAGTPAAKIYLKIMGPPPKPM